jgi:hypothetical protein
MVITNISGEKIIYPDQKVLPLSLLRRLSSAALTFLKMTGITFLFSLIPILHFVLVPVGFLITALSTWFTWKKSFVVENLEAVCPSCDHKLNISIAGQQLPLRSFCMNCRNMIYINN